MARRRLLSDDEILARVRPIFVERGFSARTRQVAAAAGLTSGAIAMRLQRGLAPWLAERFTLLAVFAGRRHMPTRTRAFLDHPIKQATQSAARIDVGRVGLLQ